MAFKIDIHNHILPERWPDLKEVSTYFAANFRGPFDSELYCVPGQIEQTDGNIERFRPTPFKGVVGDCIIIDNALLQV